MPPVAVRVIPAVASDVPLEAVGIGTVEALASVDVKARLTAPVIRVRFAEGDDVKEGQALFDLDPETWNRQIAELEANVAKDVAAERQAQANIAKDQATLRNAQSVAERGAQLLKEGIFSREQTDQVVSTADAVKASLDADQAELESARAAENADKARLAQTKLQLTFTTIAAPLTGRAGAIQIKAGNIVKENDTTLVTILETNPIYVSFSVPEDILPEVRRYDAAGPLTVTATTANGSTATGTLKFIDNTVDATTGTIRLKAIFENPQRLLWPGQFVNVRARLETEHGRVLIPSRTVETGPQGKYVWVVNPDSTAVMKTVEVLRNYTPPGKPEEAVIGSGLEPGQQVVSEGQLRLAPGAHVQLLPGSVSPS
jgi:multidrug efflux system membrane fusion protein